MFKAARAAFVNTYADWMVRRDEELCLRATDRTVRPFEYGIEWSSASATSLGLRLNGCSPDKFLIRLNEHAVAKSHDFFSYQRPQNFTMRDEWLEFESGVPTPYPANNTVRARWFPARNGIRKAVVVLPHWNSKFPQHVALCRGLQRLGISALRLSLPYHDARMPGELKRADYAVSANVGRTIDATRQAVIDTRSCFDWLEQQGFEDLGLVGTSLGSCYAFLASAHDPRIRVNVFNHCSTYFADVVWEGLSTRHIREGIEGSVDLDTLRKFWLCLSPPCYWDLYSAHREKRSKFIYTRFDTTFPVHLSKQVIKGAEEKKFDFEVAVLPCGHYTMGQFPFNYITGYQICSFFKRNL